MLALTIEDTQALRHVQLSTAARAYDAHRVVDLAKRAYRDARAVASTVQQQMRAGDRIDGDTMSTIEENNDTLDQGQRAMDRRAFIGLDHPVWDHNG